MSGVETPLEFAEKISHVRDAKISRKPWTEQDDKILSENYLKLNDDLRKIFPNRTWSGITHRILKLNLNKPHNSKTKYHALPLPEIDKAYLAGLFDGEGSISVQKGKIDPKRKTPRYKLYVNLGMTDCWNPRYLQFIFGGMLRKRPPGERTRAFYAWVAWGYQAEEALTQLYPYLTVKKEQAKLALILRSIRFKLVSEGHTRVVPQEIVGLREQIRVKIMALNATSREP